MNYLGRSSRWLRRGAAVAGSLVLLAATGVGAADVSFSATTDVVLDTQGITVQVLVDSEATTFTVSADTITAVVPSSSTLSVRSTDKREMTNNGSLTTACYPTFSQLTVTGPKTVTITPSSSQCTASSGSGGGGGGGTGGTAPPPNYSTTPPATTPPPTLTLPPTSDERAQQVIAILQEAGQVTGVSPEALAAAVGTARDQGLEQRYESTIVARVVVAGTPAADRAHVLSFVSYGTPTTVGLGAGERAGVVNSFRAAFGHVPASEADWGDVIKIANGRFPGTLNAAREQAMEATFKKIYLRGPNRANSHDDAAITVMAYGLRTGVRNLGSEQTSIRSFRAIYGYSPTSASDWDAVRAVAYSGATR